MRKKDWVEKSQIRDIIYAAIAGIVLASAILSTWPMLKPHGG